MSLDDRGWGLRMDLTQNSQSGLAVAFSGEQPARTLRQGEAHQRVEQRWNGLHAEHPPPRMLTDAAEKVVRQKGHEDAKDDVELKHACEAPATIRRRNLGDVERRGHGGNAHAETADKACDDERPNLRCDSRPHRRDKIKRAHPDERLFASPTIRGPSTNERAQHSAIQR
jgi:hypothetical protein